MRTAAAPAPRGDTNTTALLERPSVDAPVTVTVYAYPSVILTTRTRGFVKFAFNPKISSQFAPYLTTEVTLQLQEKVRSFRDLLIGFVLRSAELEASRSRGLSIAADWTEPPFMLT